MAASYLEIYNQNIEQVISTFKNLALVVDGSADKTVEVLAKLIKIKLNNGCHKPLKLLMHSSPETDLTEIKQKLKMMFGVVVVDLEDLILSHIERKTSSGKIIVEATTREHNIPESILLDIIHERIEKVDCRINGFVLDMGKEGLKPLEYAADRKWCFHLFVGMGKQIPEKEMEYLKDKLKVQKGFNFQLDEKPEDCVHKLFFEISHFYD